jgi:tetratricopeptide (TPR) repeat protein
MPEMSILDKRIEKVISAEEAAALLPVVDLALSTAPEDFWLVRSRVQLRLMAKDYSGAITDLDFLKQKDPNDLIDVIWRGVAYIGLGDNVRAKELASSLSAKKKDVLGFCSEQENWYFCHEYKRDLFSFSILIDPTDSDSYYYRGKANFYLGENLEAKRDLIHAIELGSETQPTWLGEYYQALGECEHELGEDLDAISTLHKALEYENCWDREYVLGICGEINRSNGDFKDAIKDYSEAIKGEPDYFEYVVARGDTYFELGDIDKAIKDFDTALKLNASAKEVYLKRAKCRRILGDTLGSVADLEKSALLGEEEAEHALLVLQMTQGMSNVGSEAELLKAALLNAPESRQTKSKKQPAIPKQRLTQIYRKFYKLYYATIDEQKKKTGSEYGAQKFAAQVVARAIKHKYGYVFTIRNIIEAMKR